MGNAADYDPRYLAGILFFNRRDFFEAHEVWEDLWSEAGGGDQRFFQGLIQAAVALHHFHYGNARGAVKLYRTSRAYLEPYGPHHYGLDVAGFWRQMERCFAEILAAAEPDRSLRPADDLIPVIALNPPPAHWPDPADFEAEDD